MAELLLAVLLLSGGVAPAVSTEASPDPVESVFLDSAALETDPALLAGDTLSLVVACRGRFPFRLREGEEILAIGELLGGNNFLRFSRPGLCSASQSLLFSLEVLKEGALQQVRIPVLVRLTEPHSAVLSGRFGLEMYYDGKLIGSRQKPMAELLKLPSGPVTPAVPPVQDSFRPHPAGQSVPVLGLAMALAKYLGKKKAEKRFRSRELEKRKNRLETSILRRGKDGVKYELPVVIELGTE